VKDMEKLHSKFIQQFYDALNKANQLGNSRESEVHLLIPDVPMGYEQIPDIPENLKEEYEPWVTTAKQSFEELIELNHQLKNYVIHNSQGDEKDTELHKIAEEAGSIIEKHSEAFDELQVKLERDLAKNNLKNNSFSQSDYFKKSEEMNALVRE